MSKKRKFNKQITINLVSTFIILGVLSYIPLLLIYPENNSLLVREVWEHIKFLSFIVVAYLFNKVNEK